MPDSRSWARSLGGVPELIEPGVDGAIVPPDDPGALAAALGALLDDPVVAFGMGAAGRARRRNATTPPTLHLERLHATYDEARTRVTA